MNGEMRKNIIPAIIAFAPAVLLPLIPIMSHTALLGFVLSWAPGSRFRGWVLLLLRAERRVIVTEGQLECQA